MSLTDRELEAMDLTACLVNLVCGHVIADGPARRQDVDEFCARIHAVQSMILQQSAARAHPGLFRLLGEEL